MKNVNLLELAMNETKKNIQKTRKSGNSINKMLTEILDSKKPKSRIEIVNELTFKRMEANFEITEKSFQNPEFLEEFKKVNKTCKNGLDTSLAVGKKPNRANFVWSDYGKDYEIVKVENGYILAKK